MNDDWSHLTFKYKIGQRVWVVLPRHGSKSIDNFKPEVWEFIIDGFGVDAKKKIMYHMASRPEAPENEKYFVDYRAPVYPEDQIVDSAEAADRMMRDTWADSLRQFIRPWQNKIKELQQTRRWECHPGCFEETIKHE